MKKQFWLIGICILGILAACNRKPKDGLTDTYTSGVIAIAADESFQPIVQEEIDVFEGVYPLAGIVPIRQRWKQSICFLKTVCVWPLQRGH